MGWQDIIALARTVKKDEYGTVNEFVDLLNEAADLSAKEPASKAK